MLCGGLREFALAGWLVNIQCQWCRHLLVFVNVSGNTNLCGNVSGRRIKAPLETVLGLISPWLRDGIKLVHCYLGLAGGCWCGLGHGCVLPLFTVSEWGDPAGSVIAVPICLHCSCFLPFNSDHLCVFWRNHHLWHCACVPWASLPVSCPTSRSLCICCLQSC